MSITLFKNLQQKPITPLELYRYEKQYYSRSVAGMSRDLLILKGMELEQSKKLIESWIKQDKIIPTETADNHYILTEKGKKKD